MSENRTRTPLFVGGVIILIIVFVAFFGGPLLDSGIRQQNRIVFGKYRNREVAYVVGNYFALQVAEASNRAARIGSDGSGRAVWREAFDETLFHEALLYLGGRAGIEVTEGAIDAAIASDPQLQGANGFDVALWRSLTQNERWRLRDNLREEIIHQQVLGDITSALLIGSDEIAFAEEIASNERQIRFVSIGVQQLRATDIERYVAENAALFTRVRSRRLEFSGTTRAAERIHERLRSESDNFIALAQEYSASQEGGLQSESGWYYLYELRSQYPSAENVDSLVEVAPGGVSEIVSVGESHAIFLVEEVLPPEGHDPEVLVADARNYLRNNDTTTLVSLLTEVATGLIARAAQQEGGSLLIAGQEYGLTVETSEFFGVNYGNNDLFTPVEGGESDALERAASSEDFFTAVFSLQPEEISAPIVIGDYIIVAQLVAEREADSEYADIFEDFYRSESESWQDSEARRILLKREFILDTFETVYAESVVTPVQ